MMLTTIAQASAATQFFANFFPIFVIILIFYFLWLRPNSQKEKQLRAMLDSLKKGDKVITNGGIHGTVQHVEDEVIHLKISDNTKIKISRGAIAARLDPTSK